MNQTNIRKIRVAKGLTLRELAQRLDTTPATISRWEREPQRVTVPVLTNLARVLDVDPASLLRELRSPFQPGGSTGGLVVVKRLDVVNNTGEANPFEADYISRLTSTPAEELAILTVTSDAMAPLIMPGDQALVDLTQSAAELPGIYAIKVGNVAHLRRINRLVSSGLLRVSVDNPAYGDPEEVPQDSLVICGRVIWIGKKL